MTETQGALLANRYRLVEQLGRGGMGVVWRAHDEVFNREVAVKEVLLPAELPRAERESVIQRTLREARVAAKLSHPNVVKVYDVVRAGGRPWIVMELVQAQSLTDLIEQHGPLPTAEVARIGLQVLAALGAAHGAGINHRDVKPGNVLCTDAGRVVLTDFGIASLEGDSTATSTGPLMGSPSYIAPERVRGRPASPASDLWSLAATLYAAVEGRPPYDRDGIVETVTAVVNEEPDPFRLAGPLATVLHRMFKKDPAERPSAAQTRMMLREVAGAPNHREYDHDEPRPRASIECAAWPAQVSPAPPAADATFVHTGQLYPHLHDPAAAATTVFNPGPPLLLLREPVHPAVTAMAASDRAAAQRKRGPRRMQVVLVAFAVLSLLGGGAAALRALNSSGDKLPTADSRAALENTTETPAPSDSPPAEESPTPSVDAPPVSTAPSGAGDTVVTNPLPPRASRSASPKPTKGQPPPPPKPSPSVSPSASPPPSPEPSPSPPVDPPPPPPSIDESPLP